MYHAGEHFNVNATWWPKAAPMLSHFSRCCYLLQQGLPVADDYDVINSDVIENRMEFKDVRLALPHGVSYEVIVLPERTDIPLPVLAKLEALVRDGATLLGPKPERDTSLADYPRCDEQVKTIAERIWGSGKDGETSGHSCGKGRVIADRNRVRDILQQLAKLASEPKEQQRYARLLEAIPDLPKGKTDNGRDYLLPAATGTRRNNCEKPECYAIFPFRLFGVGLPDLELAKETFQLSPKSMNGQPRTDGWAQDSIFAACVGDTEAAAQRLAERSKRFVKSKFLAIEIVIHEP